MKTSEIIIIVILVFLILFLLNNNRKENYNQFVNSENYNQFVNYNELVNSKNYNKLYGNIVYTESPIDNDLVQDDRQYDNNSCMCSAVYDPVDCNNRIYNNDCAARCAGEDLSKCSTQTFNIFDNNLDYNINSLIT